MKLKYDLTDQDPTDSAPSSFEDPKPGVYLAKILEINPGFSKGDGGKPDKDRPRLEVVLEIQDEEYKGSRVWDYVSQAGNAKWKEDQFLLALGISNSKRKGEWDTDDYIGTVIKIRIKAESGTKYGTEDYRGKVSAMMMADDADQVTEELEEIGDGVHEDTGGELEADSDGYSEEDLSELTIKALGTILTDEFDVERDDVPKGKDPKIAKILELQAAAGEDEDEGEAEQDPEAEGEGDDIPALGEAADEEEDEDAIARLTELAEENDLDPDEYATWSELAEELEPLVGGEGVVDAVAALGLDTMSLGDLREKAEELSLVTTGTKAKLIERITAAVSEEPF